MFPECQVAEQSHTAQVNLLVRGESATEGYIDQSIGLFLGEKTNRLVLGLHEENIKGQEFVFDMVPAPKLVPETHPTPLLRWEEKKN